MQEAQSPQVVIVGAGPTGLALAIELGTRSIPCLLIERNVRAGYAPRAKMTHVRTREIMRRWGIADDLAKASPFGIDHPVDIHFVTRLAGHRLVHFADALNASPRRDDRYSEHGQWIPQYKLEEVLRKKAEALPSVQLRFGMKYIGFDQVDDGVRVHVQAVETKEESSIDALYLVGADGARSRVRGDIGATMVGTPELSRNLNIIFQAPGLADAHPHGPGAIFWQLNPDAPSVIGPMDNDDRWYFVPTHLSSDLTLTDDDAVALIKRSTGIDLPYRILSSDTWVASRLIADRYRHDRIFLIGDACHLHPPFGGFGMNMGIADAFDLGWKIAAALQGWGSTTLLDSYEIERRPVHELVMDEAERNHAVLPNQLFREEIEEPGPNGDRIRAEVADLIRRTKRDEFFSLGVVLGLRYRNSPVIVDDGTEDDWVLSRDYVPSAAPGSLAPHAWLDDGRSLYDLFGPGFTLLVFAEPGADLDKARQEARSSGIPLEVVILPDAKLATLYGASRALVRPDQHVAWRGDAWPDANLLPFAVGLSTADIPHANDRQSAPASLSP